MKWQWPQIRFTLLEFVLAPPESPVEEQTGLRWGGGTGGQFELAQEPAEQEEYEEEEGFGFKP